MWSKEYKKLKIIKCQLKQWLKNWEKSNQKLTKRSVRKEKTFWRILCVPFAQILHLKLKPAVKNVKLYFARNVSTHGLKIQLPVQLAITILGGQLFLKCSKNFWKTSGFTANSNTMDVSKFSRMTRGRIIMNKNAPNFQSLKWNVLSSAIDRKRKSEGNRFRLRST